MFDNKMSVKINNLAEVNEYLKKLPEDTFDSARDVFAETVLKADARVKSLFGKRLQSRTGYLRRSLRTSVKGGSLSTLQASFYSSASVSGKSVPYAPIHEYGGTIEAKNKYKGVPGGPYLNIPTRSNKTPAGVMRHSAKTLFQNGAHIRQSKRGNWGVFLSGIMMMVLKKKVHIPPRLGMIVSSEKQIPTMLSKLVALIGED